MVRKWNFLGRGGVVAGSCFSPPSGKLLEGGDARVNPSEVRSSSPRKDLRAECFARKKPSNYKSPTGGRSKRGRRGWLGWGCEQGE